MRRMFAASIAVLSWFALVLQFVVMMMSEANQSIPPVERVVRYFSFFTILTNLIVAITTTAVALAPDTALGRFLSKPSVQTAVAVYISIVGLVYSLFGSLAGDPEPVHNEPAPVHIVIPRASQ